MKEYSCFSSESIKIEETYSHKKGLEFLTKFSQISIRVFGEKQQLPLMAFTCKMTFESVLISTLFITHLTEPRTKN